MGFETSKEMFINMNPKDIPRWNPKLHFYDQEKSVLEFYEEEFKKIKNGINIGGYKVPPLLYFHLNFFVTPIPQENGDELLMSPPLDDNIFYVVESYEEAKRLNNILFLFGTRGFAKSTFISSITQQTVITKPNGNFSIVGGSDPDLTALSSLMEKTFNNINPAFFIPTLTKEWDSHIEFGVKDKQVGGVRHIHSEIMITNVDKGTSKKSEKGAGLSPIGFVIDEALHEDTILYLEDGEKPIKDIKAGDKVFGADGKLTTVLEVVDPGVVEMYDVELSDGRVIQASENHLWTILDTEGEERVVTTAEISFTRPGAIQIPITKAIEYPKKKLHYNPFIEGNKRSFWFSSGVPNSILNASVRQRKFFLVGYLGWDIFVLPKKFEVWSDSAPNLKKFLWGLGIYFETKKVGPNSTQFHTHPHKKYVTIQSVLPTGQLSQSYCIKVDNDDHLFVAGDYVVTHNCGKFAFKKVLESAIPSFKTQHGFKLVPILSGTSGNTELSKDARMVLEDPKAYNVLPVNFDLLDKISDPDFITWEHNKKRKNFGTFVPGQMSYRIEVPKIKKSFADFIGVKNKNLAKIDIYTTDWKNATEYLKELHGTGKDESKRNRERMYFPLELDDCFLTTSPNPFPTTIIDRHIRELEDSGSVGRNIKLVRDANKFSTEFSTKRRAEVSHPGGSVDAPIIAFDEVPDTPPERFIFVSGLDDYKQNVSDTDSLGAFYVIRRRNLSPNTPCETIVASLTTRPERHRDFHVQIENMIECWSAECLMESADTSFIEYLDTRMKAGKWLAPAITFANKKGTKTNLSSAYGLYPTTGNNEYRMNLLIDWCWEQHTVGIADDGTTIVKYGVEFIDDIDLLKEMRDWKKEGNFDRIAAFSHALVHAVELDKDEVRPKSLKGQRRGILEGQSTTQWDAEKPSSKLNSAFGTRRVSSAYTFKRR